MIIITLALLVYASMCAYLYFNQRNIIYHPQTRIKEPATYELKDVKTITLRTSDNIIVEAWYKRPKKDQLVMVYLHGNTGNISDRSAKLKIFLKKDIGMIAVSYPGYGHSEGKPSEEGLYNAARASIKYLIDNEDVKLENIYIYGESLGTGVAVQMATEFKVRALVLEAAYTSMIDLAAKKYPYMPVKLLLKDKFESIKKIGNVHMPLLMFHGYKDDVVPIEEAQELLEASNIPNSSYYFESVGHSDFDLDLISDITYNFVKEGH
jgi:fermentation-respiration switch protein FrsA (DUF1100 family)